MKKHGAIYLTPFSHRLAEEIDNPEYQRLRCRVNYHALRFKPLIMKLSESIVDKLRAQGHFMSIHLRFEMDMLAFAGYVPINNLTFSRQLIKCAFMCASCSGLGTIILFLAPIQLCNMDGYSRIQILHDLKTLT